MSDSFFRIMKLADLPSGAKKMVEIGGKEVLICHTIDRVLAVSNICSHAQEKLECGRLGRTWIACPVHGARFELATGRAMNPPATRPIPTFPVRVADDWIEVQVEGASAQE
jgi:3-phenylpropionate/trans-cinnamate dioxygenase ferredoxin subunit